MPGSEPEPSQRTKTSHLLKTRLIGGVTLTLWGTAAACLIGEAEYAYDRPKTLVFAKGLFMLILILAFFSSLVWYHARFYLRPQDESRAIAEYSYRAGCRDTAMRMMQESELHLVRPMPPAAPCPQQPHDHFVKQNGSHHTKAPT